VPAASGPPQRAVWGYPELPPWPIGRPLCVLVIEQLAPLTAITGEEPANAMA
jgi:hypothetical protein